MWKLCQGQRSGMHILILLFAVSVAASNEITFPKNTETENSVALESFQVEPDVTPFREMAHHVANLGLKTLRDLAGESNVIISPLNVYSCLGILGLGAAGETKEEIHSVLGPLNLNHTISEVIKSNEGVSYASAVFLDQGFLPRQQFSEAASAEYQASVLHVNVSEGEEAKNLINSWVAERTNQTIVDLLHGRLDPETKMVIVSALLFKGKWLHSFPTAATVSGKFEIEEGVTVMVPLMHLLATVPLVRNSHFDAISLPYIDKRGMTMHLILPKTHGLPQLKKLLSHFNVNSLKKLRKESNSEEIFIVIPKLMIEGRVSLTNTLKKQGIGDIFNPTKANFSALAEDSAGLFVSQIYHSIHFEMDEDGTSAAAATASILTKSSRFIFRATRPFIFVITDESDVVLFMGIIVNPVP